MPQIWCGDNTDAVERLRIQYGTSFGYPVSAMGSHVSVSPNHQTGRETSLKTRALVAMAGTFGYEMDVRKLKEQEREEVKEQIKIYKNYYDLIHHGTYYRLTDAEQNRTLVRPGSLSAGINPSLWSAESCSICSPIRCFTR